MPYTTWGSIRGDCGHVHRSYAAAETCIERDQRGCATQGGYSDRTVRLVCGRRGVQRYDVTLGPGVSVAPSYDEADAYCRDCGRLVDYCECEC